MFVYFFLLCSSLSVVTTCFVIATTTSTITTVLHNSNSTIDLYSPPLLIPLIPNTLVKCLMLHKYLNELQNNNDIGIMQCEQFRKYYMQHSVRCFPKARFGIVGDDYLVAFLNEKNKQTGTTDVCIESILPINTNVYNITSMLQVFHMQYKPCIITHNKMSKYWQHIFDIYNTYDNDTHTSSSS